MLSVVICTRNRAEAVKKMLKSLDTHYLHEKKAELILVDNGSVDRTWEVLNEFERECLCAVKILREPSPGLSRARNLGLLSAKYSFISFLDDDAYPDRGFFPAVLNVFEHSKHDFFGGRVLLFDPKAARTSINEGKEERFFERPRDFNAGDIHGCNMHFRKAVLERTGKFDVRLGAGSRLCSGEDMDFILRALMQGFRGAFLPQIVVYHDHGRMADSPAYFKVRKGYDYGRGAVYCKCILQGHFYFIARWVKKAKRGSLPILMRELRGALGVLLSKPERE